MNARIRLHPLNALFGLRRYVVLLLIPLVRGLAASDESLAAWLTGAWIDLAVLALIVLLAHRRWKASKLWVESGKLTYARGLFWHKSDVFYAETLSAVLISRPFYLRPFGAVTVQPETLATEYRPLRPILIAASDMHLIEQVFLRSAHERIRTVAHPRPTEVARAAAASSDAVSGLVFAATLLTNSARYLGEQTANRFLRDLTRFVRGVSLGLPPIVAIPLWTLLLAYLLEFLLNLAEYYRFSVSRSQNTLFVAGGLFSRYHLQANLAAIESVDIRHGLFARWFSGVRIYASVAGFSSAGFTPAIVPAGNALEALRNLRRLLPELGTLTCPIRTDPHKALVRFTAWPLAWFGALIAVAALAATFLPPFAELILFWGVMAALILLWQILHRVAALRKTGLGVFADHVVLAYFARSRFHRVWIPRERIVRISLAQSKRMVRRGLCHVTVCETARRRRKHIVRAVDTERIKQAFEQYGYHI